jgi:hypothetical protein
MVIEEEDDSGGDNIEKIITAGAEIMVKDMEAEAIRELAETEAQLKLYFLLPAGR